MVGGTVREQLGGLAALGDWSDHELDELAQLGDLVQVGPGTCLTREGVPARQAFLLVSGRARAVGGPAAGIELGPGDLVCELEPLTGSPAAATVRTESVVSMLVLSPLSVVRLRRLRSAALAGEALVADARVAEVRAAEVRADQGGVV